MNRRKTDDADRVQRGRFICFKDSARKGNRFGELDCGWVGEGWKSAVMEVEAGLARKSSEKFKIMGF